LQVDDSNLVESKADMKSDGEDETPSESTKTKAKPTKTTRQAIIDFAKAAKKQKTVQSSLSLGTVDDSKRESVILSATSATGTTTTVEVKSPPQHDLAKDRAPKTQKPKEKGNGKKQKTPRVKVKPKDRLKEFPDQGLIEDRGVIICTACELSFPNPKKSKFVKHVETEKHKGNLKEQKGRLDRSRTITQTLRDWEKKRNLGGENVSNVSKALRLETVEEFLNAGIPLNALSRRGLRRLIERGKQGTLTDRSHLAQLIPFLLENERKAVQAEIGKEPFSVFFDGTSNVAEVFCIGVRYVA